MQPALEPAAMRRTRLPTAPCPIARTLDLIGDWWSLLILRDAMLGRRRFNEFQASLGLARNILSARLRALVEHGILETVPAPGHRHEYQLTEKGRDLFTVLVALRQWGERHLFPGETPGTCLVDRASGQPVATLQPHAADGRALAPEETELRPPEPPSAKT